MPYIPLIRREALDCGKRAANPGELNYLLTGVITDYLIVHGLNYEALNDAVGALECAKLELYRRKAADYEDKKRELNGDVYPPSDSMGP